MSPELGAAVRSRSGGPEASPITIASAPCCWRTDDMTSPHLPSWERVLDEAVEVGFGGLEFGPHGCMPFDGGRASDAPASRGSFIMAGTTW